MPAACTHSLDVYIAHKYTFYIRFSWQASGRIASSRRWLFKRRHSLLFFASNFVQVHISHFGDKTLTYRFSFIWPHWCDRAWFRWCNTISLSCSMWSTLLRAPPIFPQHFIAFIAPKWRQFRPNGSSILNVCRSKEKHSSTKKKHGLHSRLTWSCGL